MLPIYPLSIWWILFDFQQQGKTKKQQELGLIQIKNYVCINVVVPLKIIFIHVKCEQRSRFTTFIRLMCIISFMLLNYFWPLWGFVMSDFWVLSVVPGSSFFENKFHKRCTHLILMADADIFSIRVPFMFSIRVFVQSNQICQIR